MRGAQANAWARYPVAARTPGYELHFVLSRADVHHIRKNNLMIAIMKKVKSNASSDSDVIWVASSAFRKVLVCWREDYAVYASATDIEAGNAVVLNSLMRADTGHSYIFEGGTFSDDGVASGDAFHVVNQSSIHHRLTLGLAQGATVNGNDVLSPTVAAAAPRNVSLRFKPSVSVAIFLQRRPAHAVIHSGAIIASRTGKPLTVTPGEGDPIKTIGFDRAENSFFVKNP